MLKNGNKNKSNVSKLSNSNKREHAMKKKTTNNSGKEANTKAEKMNIAYIRLSTGAQADKSGAENQKKEIQKALASKNIKIDKFLTDVSTGTDMERVELKTALKMAKNNKLGVLAVGSLCRLSRIPKDLRTIMRTIANCGVRFISAKESLDTDNEPGRQIRILSGYIVKHSTQIRNQNLENGKRVAIENGFPGSGLHPFGYRYENGDFVVVPEEAEVVKRIFYRASDEVTDRGIARELNDDNIPSPRDSAWSGKTIGNILTNPIYIGVLVRSIHRDKKYTYKKSYTIVDLNLATRISKKVLEMARRGTFQN